MTTATNTPAQQGGHTEGEGMSNEFKIDGAGEGYEYTDSTGDSLYIFKARIGGPGEDLYVGAASGGGSDRAAYVNARELIAAVQKVADLDITIIDNAVYREVFGQEPTGMEAKPIVAEEPKPKSPWFEIAPRYRAIKVTEEVVRDQTWNRHASLRPKYHEYTGEPLGFEYGEDEKLIPVGDVAIIAPNGTVMSRLAEYFEAEYGTVAA